MEPTGTVTRRAAKGIPPRVRSPPKAKRKAIPKKVGKDLKRHVSESSDDESEQPSSDDLRPKVKKAKRHHTDELEEEEEIIDGNVESAVENVDDINAEQAMITRSVQS